MASRKNKRYTLPIILVVLIIVTMVSGCSLQPKSKLESAAASSGMLAEYRSEGIRITTITCEKEVELKKGNIFVCRVNGIDGSSAPIRVQQVDTKGSVVPIDTLVKTEEMQQQIMEDLSHEIGTQIIDAQCPNVALAKKGNAFVCKIASKRGGKASVLVRLKNKQGDAQYKLLHSD